MKVTIDSDMVQETPSGCWEWLGGVQNGYGYASGDYVYRMVVAIRDGRNPARPMSIDHVCRNTLCVRPDHLEVVHQKVNVRRGERAKLTPGLVREIRSLRALGHKIERIRELLSVRVGKSTIHRVILANPVERGSWSDIL
jgi:hypothetical protein